MQDIIDRIIEESPEPQRGILSLSEDKITLTVDPGETVEEYISASSLNGRPVEGFVMTDEPRFRVLTPHFFGKHEEIGFTVSMEGLRGGDHVEGRIYLVTDCGETTVPVSVNVRKPYPVIRDETGEEEMKNLFHFANLARRSFDAATRLFYDRERMYQFFLGADKKYRTIYRGLVGADQNSVDAGISVEEFLIAIRKKEPIVYEIDRTELFLDRVAEDQEETFRITRRGWGYTYLDIETDGAFLAVRKNRLSDRDFLGNVANLSVEIRSEELHEGRNFGSIRIHNAYTQLQIDVTVIRDSDSRTMDRKSEYREKQMMEMSLIRTYIAYRLGRMRSREWLLETGKIVSRMNTLAPDDVRFQMYTAHYLITASRENEAIWVLDRVRTSVEETGAYGDAMRAYFLYLETLLSRQENKISAVEEIIGGMLSRTPDDWRLAWLLQFLLHDHASGNARRMRLYEEQFEYGCRSPILYIEAIDLMGRDPSILKKIDPFTLYVLTFAARHHAIPRTLIDRVVWLLMREKHGSSRYYKILTACYDADHDSGAVGAICSLLIKDARMDEEAFVWYRRGVEEDLQITRLYEYYMSSYPAPRDGDRVEEIPRQVLLYFSYRSELPYDKNALLYRYVIAHREEEPELYQNYLPQIEQFVSEQMSKGRIDHHLGELYTEFSTLQPQDPISAERFFEAMNTVEIAVDDPRIRRVVLVYDRLRSERVYPVTDRSVRIPMYGGDVAILFEDREGRRYTRIPGGHETGEKKRAKSERKTPADILAACHTLLPFLREGNANINLYLMEADRLQITADNVDRYRRLVESDALTSYARNELSCALIRFYYDNDFVRQLADYLPLSHPERMSQRERCDALEIMVLSGIYEQAFMWISRFGLSGLSGTDDKMIYRLASRSIARGDYPDNETADMVSFAAFRSGKHDEGILLKLVKRFTGLMKDEQAIFKACGAFSVECLPLAERMLTQLLFTGAHALNEDKLLAVLAKNDGSIKIQKACLTRRSRDNLFAGEPMGQQMVERIRALCLAGESIPPACRLAYLKYYAENPQQAPDEEVLTTFLMQLEHAEKGMPFLYAYRQRIPELALADGMRFVQVTGAPGTAAAIFLKRSDEGEYHQKRMTEPYPGIYTYGEALFPGESLSYYITMRQDGVDRLSASGEMKCDLMDDPPEGESRFALTSRLLRARTQNDRAAVHSILYSMYKNEFLCEKLFPLPGENKE